MLKEKHSSWNDFYLQKRITKLRFESWAYYSQPFTVRPINLIQKMIAHDELLFLNKLLGSINQTLPDLMHAILTQTKISRIQLLYLGRK